MKVYVLMGHDCTGSYVIRIFANKERAEESKTKYELMDKLYVEKIGVLEETFFEVREFNVIE